MKDRSVARRGVVPAVVLVAAFAFATTAVANNLDRQTATDSARKIAKRDCQATSGCQDYRVANLRRISRHKWLGKIHTFGVKRGERSECTRQVVVKLDHETGKIFYATSKRRCVSLGPA
jgi:hypothetical protein